MMDKAIKKRIEQIARGEAPEGYEKTAFGIFPCDWEKVSIGDTAAGKGEYGLNAPACEYESDLPKYLRITDINDDFRYIDSGARIRSKYCNEYRLKDGDIVFARTGASVGKNYLYNSGDGELIYAGFLIKFSIKKQYDPYLVALNCRTKKYSDWVTKISARSGQPGINAEEYATYEFVVPKSTEEQRKIADILMLWDKAIELKEKLIAEKDKQKQYLMDVLLTGKVRLPGFSDDWERVELKEICQIKKGEQINKQMLTSSGKYPVINGGISPSGYYSQYNREAGTISISEGGNSCGHVAMNEESFWSGGHCYTIHDIVSQVDEKYLFYYLKQNERAIKSMRVGSGLPNIQLNSLKRMFVEFPSYTYQRKIADLLSTLDNSLVALYKQLILQRKQRDALMQLLLTGIVRVKYE